MRCSNRRKYFIDGMRHDIRNKAKHKNLITPYPLLCYAYNHLIIKSHKISTTVVIDLVEEILSLKLNCLKNIEKVQKRNKY